MPVRKYWRELYLTLMVSTALAIIIAAAFYFSDITGLSVTAGGVFIAVLGVGFYDQWQAADLAKERIRTRR
jgi:hypothetical protein